MLRTDRARIKRWRFPVIYTVAIPLALILGYLVSTPDAFTFTFLGLIMFFLAIPLLLKWHHAGMIFFWNTAFNAFFLPGQPDFWLVLSALSFGVSLLNHIVFQKSFLRAPEMTRPVLFLGAVVILTACLRGGIGIRALGGAVNGGRYYIFILGAIVGYFALTAEAIPQGKADKMIGLFFISGVTAVLANVAYTLGPSFYFLYYLVSPNAATGQAATDFGLNNLDRIQGLAVSGVGLLCFLLARYGIRGLVDLTKPWRLLLLISTLGAACFAGFRSSLIQLLLILAFQCYFERLLRTHVFPIVVALAVCGFVPIAIFSQKMPPAVQRALSFLPINVDSDVRADAKGSTEWRMDMWSVVWKDVPKYLVLGKGYGLDPTELFLTTEGVRLGILDSYEEAMLAGDYHSGPLSVLVPFGIPGTVAFLWVLGAGGWVLYSNHRYGDAKLRRVNCVLLSYYVANCICFFFVFGAFNTQLFCFLGAAGLSVSLNGGVQRPLNPKRGRHAAAKVFVLAGGDGVCGAKG